LKVVVVLVVVIMMIMMMMIYGVSGDFVISTWVRFATVTKE
jgi:hypothetical protein